MAKTGGFFSPNRKSSSKDKQVAGSQFFSETKQPLSPIGSDDYNKEVEGFIKEFKTSPYYRRNYDLDTGERIDKYFNPIPGEAKFGEEEMRRDYPYRRQFRYEHFDGGGYTPGVPYGKADTDTEVASAFSAGSGLFGDDIDVGDGVFRTKEQIIKMRDYPGRFNLEPGSKLFKQIQEAGRGLVNLVTGTQPVAAGTLDSAPRFAQVSQVSERPKLGYVNPDAKTMSLSEIGEAFKPRNLFGYKDKFGRFDDPGSPLARDRAETMQRVAQNFNAPITPDARTIGQIRADQEARMRENARLRNESFQRGERVQQKSADVTYGTNMLSNPAFGFRDKMTDAAKAQYDRSAKDATEMARTDPSLGNVAMQTFNRISGLVGGPQASLEKIGERQLRLANKEINRPTYQKEAYARKMLGITNEQLKARNLQRIRANAEARTQAFQNERVQKALEKAAIRRGENIGTGRDGGFGLGTSGQGLPSNPKGFSGYSRKSSPSTGTGTGTGTSTGRISKSTSRGQGGGPSSRSKGGTGTGKSTQGRGRGGSTGGSGASSKGGTGTGRTSTSRTASKASKSRTGRSRSQCDIRTKIDITSLTNQNLTKDDLATVAYFVQELRGE